jgi:hypothetical protein
VLGEQGREEAVVGFKTWRAPHSRNSCSDSSLLACPPKSRSVTVHVVRSRLCLCRRACTTVLTLFLLRRSVIYTCSPITDLDTASFAMPNLCLQYVLFIVSRAGKHSLRSATFRFIHDDTSAEKRNATVCDGLLILQLHRPPPLIRDRGPACLGEISVYRAAV